MKPPESGRRWYQIRNAAKDDTGPAELLIYDEIDSWFGVAPEQLVKDLATVDADREIVVRINSPGGYVYDGITILNALRAHKGRVTVIVDGLAASAASFIAMAGDEIVMNRNAEMMVHNGRGFVSGGFEDMRKMADNLERANRNIASIYSERAGGTIEDWLAVMDDETWFTAAEAVEAGLADRVQEPPQRDAGAPAARFDLSIFNHAGRAAAPAPRIRMAHNEPPLPAEAEVNKKEDSHMATLQEGLAQKLGIPADADTETMLAAVDEALAERAEPALGEPTVEQAAAVVARFGLTVVNKEANDKLLADVRAFHARHAALDRADDERIVDEAIRVGRIAPASRESFLNYMRADREGARNALESIATNTIPVAEIGHAYTDPNGAGSVDPALEAMYAKLVGLPMPTAR